MGVLTGFSGCVTSNPDKQITPTQECPMTVCFGCGNPWTDLEVTQALISNKRCKQKYGENYCLVRLVKYNDLQWSAVCRHMSDIP